MGEHRERQRRTAQRHADRERAAGERAKKAPDPASRNQEAAPSLGRQGPTLCIETRRGGELAISY